MVRRSLRGRDFCLPPYFVCAIEMRVSCLPEVIAKILIVPLLANHMQSDMQPPLPSRCYMFLITARCFLTVRQEYSSSRDCVGCGGNRRKHNISNFTIGFLIPPVCYHPDILLSGGAGIMGWCRRGLDVVAQRFVPVLLSGFGSDRS